MITLVDLDATAPGVTRTTTLEQDLTAGQQPHTWFDTAPSKGTNWVRWWAARWRPVSA